MSTRTAPTVFLLALLGLLVTPSLVGCGGSSNLTQPEEEECIVGVTDRCCTDNGVTSCEPKDGPV